MKRLLGIIVVTSLSVTAMAQTAKTQKAQAPAAPAPEARQKNLGLIGKAVDKEAQSANYGMAGCGLGSVLFGESESKLGQVLAVTTNDYASNNSFGMSSGTSNCIPEKAEHTAQVKKNMEMFVAANKEALANDIVKSQGETIVSISEIMGCRDVNYLGATLQSRYETIFDSKKEAQIADNMFSTVSSDRYLLENCKL